MEAWDRAVDACPDALAAQLRPLRRTVVRLRNRHPAAFRAALAVQQGVDELVDYNAQFRPLIVMYQQCSGRAVQAARRGERVVWLEAATFWQLAAQGQQQAAQGPPPVLPPIVSWGGMRFAVERDEGLGVTLLDGAAQPRVGPMPDAWARVEASPAERLEIVCAACHRIAPAALVCPTCMGAAWCCPACRCADAEHAAYCRVDRESAEELVDTLCGRESWPFVACVFYTRHDECRIVAIPASSAVACPQLPTDVLAGMTAEHPRLLGENNPLARRLLLQRTVMCDGGPAHASAASHARSVRRRSPSVSPFCRRRHAR